MAFQASASACAAILEQQIDTLLDRGDLGARNSAFALIQILADLKAASSSNAFFPATTIQRPANTDIYLANKQYGETLQFSNFGPANGAVYLVNIRITLNIAALPPGMGGFLLFLYSAMPPSARVNNDPFSIPAGDRASCLTTVGIPLTAQLALGGGSVVLVANNVDRMFPVPATGTVFGCLVTTAAFTPAANSETGTITLGAIEV